MAEGSERWDMRVDGWWLAVDRKGNEGELSRVAGRVGDRWGERKGKLSGRRGLEGREFAEGCER